ncbi:MAG: ATP-binding protein [Saprospiraceae bacterium]
MIAVLEASARSSLALGELDDALEISNEAVIQLKQFETSGKSMDEDYQVYRTHALILSKFNKTFEALEASQKALDIVTDRQELTPIARCNQTIAEVYAALGQREKSLHFFDAAKSTFISHNDPNELLEVLQKESHVLAEMGRYKEAFFMKDRCQSLKDSIASISQAGRILDLRDLQETKRVRHELALAQAEQVVLETQQDLDHNQKIAMALGLAFFVSALILFYFKLTRRKRAQKVLEEMVKERTGSLERKAEELDLNAQALLCSNRELERFAFVASHDLKTPIRNINSFLTLIKRRKNTISKEELAEYIDIAISYGKQLHAIVNDILEFSRIGTDVKDISSEIQLLGFFTGLKTQFTPELTEKNASIEISGHALMKAPQGYLNQIFTNLITNGLKYNESLFPKVKVNIEEKDGQTVSITIADNGIGIEKEYQAQVFEMFKRLHTIDEYEGTGLGLAVCKKVVERLGGTIELESTFGEGSTFIIELPLDCTAASKQETHPMADLA